MKGLVIASAFVVVCLVIGGASADLTTAQINAIPWTEDYGESSYNATHCNIITNFPVRNKFPAKFKAHVEDCSETFSGLICEIKVASAGAACPSTINDFQIGDSCYETVDGWRNHARNAAICRHLDSNARLLHIADNAELLALGGQIAYQGLTTCGVTAEFSVGNAAPPAAGP